MGWRGKEYSKVLGMLFAYNDSTKQVMTEDRTVYNESECLILLESGGLDKNVHRIKGFFRGEIVKRRDNC